MVYIVILVHNEEFVFIIKTSIIIIIFITSKLFLMVTFSNCSQVRLSWFPSRFFFFFLCVCVLQDFVKVSSNWNKMRHIIPKLMINIHLNVYKQMFHMCIYIYYVYIHNIYKWMLVYLRIFWLQWVFKLFDSDRFPKIFVVTPRRSQVHRFVPCSFRHLRNHKCENCRAKK